MSKDGIFNINENVLIILSAKSDKNKQLNSLRKVGANKNTVIDIQLESLKINFTKKYIVLGESHENWKKNDFKKIINKEWYKSKSGYSLSLAIQEINTNGQVWILYSDIIFRDLEISESLENKNLIYIDNEWETRFSNRKKRDNSLIELVKSDNNSSINLFFTNNEKEIEESSEMCGIIKLTNKSFYDLKNVIKTQKKLILKNLSTSELLEISRLSGIKYKSLNISGKYCQLNIDDDLIRYFLGTKADSLEKLKMIGLKNGVILDQYKFTVQEWEKDSSLIIKNIIDKFKYSKIVIRSSCLEEDQLDSSAAGKFESQLSVDCKNLFIQKAVTKVIKSYGGEDMGQNQVLVQRFLNNVDFSGVAFSRSIENNGPYISINISYQDTKQVTSGSKCQEYFIHRENIKFVKDKNLNKVIQCLLEIESLLKYKLLDIEFALVNNKVYVLQLRPLIVSKEYIDDKKINKYVTEANSEIKNLFKQKQKVYSLMSDWNPAEIIGKLPSILSSSIYKYIITEKNWSLSRKLDGYKDINSPLLISILGTDYVDVFKSIKSFIPNNISENITEKIESKAYKTLSENPSLHDKLEFEIIPTCIDLNWHKWEIYFKDFLSSNELETYKKSLISNTKNIMELTVKSEDQKSIKELISVSSLDQKSKLIKSIYLLEKISDKLAIEFARSARRAFIVASWLKSGLDKKIISKRAELGFYKSLKTISCDFINDISENKATDYEISVKYGHLRPSSYDIQSKCYLYRNINKVNFIRDDKNNNNDDLHAWENEKEIFLEKLKFLLGFEENINIEKIMRESVTLREKNKFEFTKLLSSSLELIAEYCEPLDINRYQASHISIQTFKEIAFSNNGIETTKDILYKEFKSNESKRKVFEFIHKPDIFIKGNELIIDQSLNCRPTYIGKSISEGEVIKLEDFKNENKYTLENKIVLIENADPGYDFIFGYKIKGLITMYGGSNSHMTIRCSELNVIAAIGVGNKMFNEIRSNSLVQINPILKTIQAI